MQRCDDLSLFVSRPAGSYLARPTWMIWCVSPDLAGVLVWGRHSAADVSELIDGLHMTAALATPYDFISDFSRVAAIDIVAFERLLHHIQEQRKTYFETTRTSVLVRPSGFASALAAGAFRLYSAATEWSRKGESEVGTASPTPAMATWRRTWPIVDTSDAAFSALARPDANAARLAVEAAFSAEARTDVEISTLHSLLLKTPTLTLAEAAKQLKLSGRSLQRKLEDAGTNFRKLASESKLQEAKRLLEGTDEKLSEIARRVGLSSAEQLNKLFRAMVGENPSTIRRRARGDE